MEYMHSLLHSIVEPWYPRCWPSSVDESEIEEPPVVVRDKMTVAKAAWKAKQKER
jgi:hypothetical protein